MMKRPPGRPPLDPSDRSVQLSTSLPSKHWAQLKTQAKVERVSPHELVRRLLGVDRNKSI
jgi:hypothetical protein